MRWLAARFSFLCNAFIAAIFIGAALPGTHRVVCPDCYGLVEIAPRVWTDARGRNSELVQLTENARNRVGSFFGDKPPHPTTVLCSTWACAKTFGIGGNGLSIGYFAVMVSPRGLTIGTLTHEMTHSRTHRNMGIRNIMKQPFPTWFDEGLATHVANHPNWRGTVTVAARTRVRKATRRWHWGSTMRDLGVGRAYGTAAAEVAAIERQVGRPGLLALVARADAGESFDQLLADIKN